MATNADTINVKARPAEGFVKRTERKAGHAALFLALTFLIAGGLFCRFGPQVMSWTLDRFYYWNEPASIEVSGPNYMPAERGQVAPLDLQYTVDPTKKTHRSRDGKMRPEPPPGFIWEGDREEACKEQGLHLYEDLTPDGKNHAGYHCGP